MTSTNLADRYVGRVYARQGGTRPGTWKIVGATMLKFSGSFYYALQMRREPGGQEHVMGLAQFRKWVRRAERLG